MEEKQKHPSWMYRKGEERLFDDISGVPKDEGWVDSPAKVGGEGGEPATWPPTEEALAAMDTRALGELLKARGGDPKTVKTADERLAAIRELIAKEPAK